MSYQEALEAAGATIKEFKEFGSYQGTWMAHLDNGNLVEGYYGSCSGCDSFLSEFDFQSHEHTDNEYFNPLYNRESLKDDCEKCQDFKKRFQEFGQNYLTAAVPLSQVVKCYEEKCKDEYCYSDDKEILEWLKGLK